jgi:hypothetical protein
MTCVNIIRFSIEYIYRQIIRYRTNLFYSAENQPSRIENPMVDASDRIRKRVQQAFAGIAANEYYGPGVNPPVYTPLTPGELSVVAQSPFACTNPCSDSTQSGSLYFTNSPQTYLQVANASKFNIDSSPFTIQWWQYMETPPTVGSTGSTVITPTVFAFTNSDVDPQILAGRWSLTGPTYTTYQFELIVSGSIYTYSALGTLPNILDKWVHVAIVGDGTDIRVYYNGAEAGVDANGYNITNDTAIYPYFSIGNTNPSSGLNQFPGFITNFQYLTSIALYLAPFTPPKQPIALGEDEVKASPILLLANANQPLYDSGINHYTVTEVGGAVTWNTVSPFYNTQN